MIFCVIWFTSGIHVHLMCREMKDGELADTVMDMVIKSADKPDISVADILSNCRQNVGLYQATAYLEKKYNITEKIKFDKVMVCVMGLRCDTMLHPVFVFSCLSMTYCDNRRTKMRCIYRILPFPYPEQGKTFFAQNLFIFF